MLFKTIIQGRLNFGTERSFEKAIEMYNYRLDNFYRMELVYKEPTIFVKEDLSLTLPRTVMQITSKTWRNTVDLIQYLAQFAISGNVGAWLIDDGKIKNYIVIEPTGDKAAVQHFLKGRKLLEEGKETEAIEALNDAISKHNKHAQAYERRGYINYTLGNFDDAIYDYSKSIKLDDHFANAYLGRAYMYIKKKKYQEAINDLKKTTEKSIALQTIYWKARRIKAETHIKLKQYKEAAFDMKLFTTRKFKEGDKNFKYKRYSHFLYGKILLELGADEEAIVQFEKALLSVDNGKCKEKDIYLLLGQTKKKLGVKGFLADLRKAKDLGAETAEKDLKKP